MDLQTVLLFITVALLVYIAFRGSSGSNVRSEIEGVQRTLNERLDASNKVLSDHLHKQNEQSSNLIAGITREMTEVKEIGKQTLSFAEQMQYLKNVLVNTQSRGVLGERVLEMIVGNVLPKGAYEQQYHFKKSNVRADVAVFLDGGKVVCVDAKFSLTAYANIVGGDETEE